MPAVAPKLPSIWKGGCASKRFGRCRRRSACPRPRREADGREQQPSSLCARSPSPRRAQRLIFQRRRPARAAVAARLERPRAASAKSRRRPGVIWSPGYESPEVRDVAVRRLGLVEVFEPFLELAVACRPGTGRSRARFSQLPRNSASTPRIAPPPRSRRRARARWQVHRGAHADGRLAAVGHRNAFSGELRRGGDEPACARLLDEEVGENAPTPFITGRPRRRNRGRRNR